MDGSTAVSLGEAAGPWLFGVGSVFWARLAAKRSAPTSNGWTEGLGRRLDKLDGSLERIDERAKDNATALATVQVKLDQHLRDHLVVFRGLPTDKD